MTEPPRPPWEGNPGDSPPPEQPPYQGGTPSTGPGESGGASYPPPSDSGAGPYPPPGGTGQGYYPQGGTGGGYHPPPGAQQYGAQQYGWQPGGTPPAGYPSPDDRNWALAAHFGGAVLGFFSGGVLGWIVPLIAMVGRGNQSPTVRQHAVGALNFQILWSIVAAAGYILGTCLAITVVGLVFYIAVPTAMIIELVFGLIAGARANNGQMYRYPMSVNFVK